MKKKPVFILGIIVLLIILGSLAATQCGGGVFRTLTNTATYTNTFTDTPNLPPANVKCNELTFHLDPTLGDGFACETLPESSSTDVQYYPLIYPAHTELTIQDYPITDTQFPPQVLIYPVNRFNELLPDILPALVSDLKWLISSDTWGGGELPFLPAIIERQSFFSHVTSMSFNDGRGIRFITAYSELVSPISNRSLIYTFQGLTDDGMYWVAITHPISSPILPAGYHTLPEGYTRESLIQDYVSYARDVKDALEAQAPDSFFPTIDSLDNLVKSITVRP